MTDPQNQINQNQSGFPANPSQLTVKPGGAESVPTSISAVPVEQPVVQTPEAEVQIEHGPEFAAPPQVPQPVAQAGVVARGEKQHPDLTQEIQQIKSEYAPHFSSPEEAAEIAEKGPRDAGRTWLSLEVLFQAARGAKNLFTGSSPKPSEG